MSDRTVRRVRAEVRAKELGELLGIGRLHLFVPALMSVGLVFWVVSELTEVARSRADDARERRAGRVAAVIVDEVQGRPTGSLPGLRPRPVYLLIGVVLLGAAAYVVIGSAGNYLRVGGYVHDISWLLATAGAAAVLAVLYGFTALVVGATWPSPPPWAAARVLRSPLASPDDGEGSGARPPWPLTAAVASGVALLAALAALVAWSPVVVSSFNTEVSRAFVDDGLLGGVVLFDSYGAGAALGALAVLALLVAGSRCRVLLAAGLGAVGASVLVGLALRPLVAQVALQERTVEVAPRSFPSVAAALTVVLIGCLVLALVGLTRSTVLTWLLRAAGALLTVAVVVHHLAVGELPTDVLGGLLLGLILLLGVHWALADERLHSSCRACPSAPAPVGGGGGGGASGLLVGLHLPARGRLRLAARGSAALVTVGLAVLTFTVDLGPRSEGSGAGWLTAHAVPLALTLVLSSGALLAARRPGWGAAVMAVAAVALGIVVGLAHPAWVAVVLAGVLAVPVVLSAAVWFRSRAAPRPPEPDGRLRG